MKMKDNQKDKNSGAAKVTCKFYDKLDEIFRKSPSVKPISIAFSRNYKNFPSTSNILNIVSDEHSDILNIEFDENLKLQPKKKLNLKEIVFAWLSTFREDGKRREKRRSSRETTSRNIKYS